jgi:hypothetical protein
VPASALAVANAVRRVAGRAGIRLAVFREPKACGLRECLLEEWNLLGIGAEASVMIENEAEQALAIRHVRDRMKHVEVPHQVDVAGWRERCARVSVREAQKPNVVVRGLFDVFATPLWRNCL